MAPRGIGSFFMMPLTGLMTGRFDARKLLTRRAARRRRHAALAVAAQPAGRLLGHLLAAAASGRRHVAAVRAADDGLDGRDPARADGQRHQPLQPDAQHRRQHRHRDDRHAARAPPAGDDGDARRATSRAYDPASQSMFAQTARRRSWPPAPTSATATNRAYAALFGMVQRQASMVSFVGIFQLLGVHVPRADPAGAADEAARSAAARRPQRTDANSRARTSERLVQVRLACRLNGLYTVRASTWRLSRSGSVALLCVLIALDAGPRASAQEPAPAVVRRLARRRPRRGARARHPRRRSSTRRSPTSPSRCRSSSSATARRPRRSSRSRPTSRAV